MRSKVQLYSLLGILVFVAVLYLGHRWGITNEATTAVTAVYVVLVYFQLGEMRRQREQQAADKKADLDLEWKNRPILSLDVGKRLTPILDISGQVVGRGCYVTCSLVNMGKTIARNCQPIVTQCGKLKQQDERRGAIVEEWVPTVSWVPVPLMWSLDEIHSVIEKRPTEDRHLVPKRPYLFDLGECNTLRPDLFSLRLILAPAGQESAFQKGGYCFEVTVFSENADLVRKWYLVRWSGNLDVGFGDQSKVLDFAPRLEVEQLDSQPWGTEFISIE